MDDDFLDRIAVAVPTVLIGGVTFTFSLTLSRLIEFMFRRSFGEIDSLLKHVAMVSTVCTLLLVATAMSAKK